MVGLQGESFSGRSVVASFSKHQTCSPQEEAAYTHSPAGPAEAVAPEEVSSWAPAFQRPLQPPADSGNPEPAAVCNPGPPLELGASIALCGGSIQVSPPTISAGGRPRPLGSLSLRLGSRSSHREGSRGPRELSPGCTLSSGDRAKWTPESCAQRLPLLPPQRPRQADGCCPTSRVARG